jgi:anhydro-N-acetylmuramic acid kinase
LAEFRVTGVMSGSSLDGLDLAECRFHLEAGEQHPRAWAFSHTHTLPLPDAWVMRLRDLPESSALEVAAAHAAYGRYIGEALRNWHKQTGARPDLVAVHGHTLFHEPGAAPGFSTQIGDGAWIVAGCGLPVVTDFRTADIAAGGQGAPMAPLTDVYLFPEMDGWLNLGGIANLTLRLPDGRVLAWDICGANQLLNALAAEAGMAMDEDGRLSAQGRVQEELLAMARTNPWYLMPPPRSLSNRQVREELIPLFSRYPAPLPDRLRTALAFVAGMVSDALPGPSTGRDRHLMITGGGAFHPLLMTELKAMIRPLGWTVRTSSPDLIQFKEALLIALAGLLRWRGLPNFIPSASGATVAVCGGALYLPPPSAIA